MSSRITFLFISPHLDDAVLACGGYMHRLARQGAKLVIVSAVTAEDTSHLPPSWLARRNLAAWGLQERVFAVRCEEEASAARTVGAEVVHLGFLDCVYRRDRRGQPLYRKDVRGVPVDPFDWEAFDPALQSALGNVLEQQSCGDGVVRIVCPLAVGGHVDHILVRHAVEATTRPDERIYYEDCPYSLRMEAGLKTVEQLTPCIIPVSEEDMEARLKACACYRSQIPGLFPSRLDMLIEILQARLLIVAETLPPRQDFPAAVRRMNKSLRAHTSRIGGERYWTAAASADIFGLVGGSHA